MNIKNKSVEIRSSKHTNEPGAVQKAEDFIKAYAMGFDVDDAIALIRLDGVSFSILSSFVLQNPQVANADDDDCADIRPNIRGTSTHSHERFRRAMAKQAKGEHTG